jgi:hypothetical protein
LKSRGGVVALAVNVADSTTVERARDATLDEFGRIDILVNNAGIGGPTQATWEYSLDTSRQVMAVKLDGPFHCCRAVVPRMIAKGHGRMVNIASIAGKEGNPKASAYSASKAGLIALTKSLGKELAAYDIGQPHHAVGAREIAHGLMPLIGHPHCGGLAGPQQLGQFHRIAPVEAVSRGPCLVEGNPRHSAPRRHCRLRRWLLRCATWTYQRR